MDGDHLGAARNVSPAPPPPRPQLRREPLWGREEMQNGKIAGELVFR